MNFDLVIPALAVGVWLLLVLLFAFEAYQLGAYRRRTAQDLLDEALAEQDARRLLRDPKRARLVLLKSKPNPNTGRR